MKRIVLTIFLILNMLEAKEYTLNVYTIKIDVNNTKSNGLSWDFSGGSPDIYIKVDGRKIPFQPKCRNQYRCSIEFISKSKKHWYFEIYDKDFSSDDLIGKGECSLKEKCTLGNATVYID